MMEEKHVVTSFLEYNNQILGKYPFCFLVFPIDSDPGRVFNSKTVRMNDPFSSQILVHSL